MKCHFCQVETRMTVKKSNEEIIACCKPCKDEKNGPIDPDTGLRKMKLWVHSIQKED